MVESTIIGLDVAKQIFQVHGVSVDGQVTVRRKLRRSEVLGFFGKLGRCTVGLEACGGSYFWAREIGSLGHEVRLIPPAYVKPYVKRGKTDAVDAEAICEAVSRPTMRFIPIKTAECQAALMVLKTRDLLVRQRTQAVNALNPALRSLLVVGATSVLRHARRGATISPWLTALLARRPAKVAAIALANKMARIVWALLTKGGTFIRKNLVAEHAAA